MQTNFDDVKAFFERFEVPYAVRPQLLDHETYKFRVARLAEELNEFMEAHDGGDLEGAADALVDLSYIVLGTALCMGLPWQLLWDEVQRANMSKVHAERPEDSKHGTTLDVIKPEGWKAPDHSAALAGVTTFEEPGLPRSWNHHTLEAFVENNYWHNPADAIGDIRLFISRQKEGCEGHPV